MSTEQKHGNTGKRNAAKPLKELKTARVNIPCRPTDKEQWAATAKAAGRSLADWAAGNLNIAAGGEDRPRLAKNITARVADLELRVSSLEHLSDSKD